MTQEPKILIVEGINPDVHHTTNTPLPISLVPERQILPRRYVIHKHSQHCRNCGTVHSWAATYAFNEMMTRTGAGKTVLNLVPITEFRYNLPIEVITVARREVPVCHECPERLTLTHLPDPRLNPDWHRQYNIAPAPEAPQKKRSASSGAKPKTLDDLEAM